jgi:hypothetical protein
MACGVFKGLKNVIWCVDRTWQIENAMKGLKDDPEMGEIFAELESGGPAAMMKYWNDPNVLKKLGDTMGGVFDFQVGFQLTWLRVQATGCRGSGYPCHGSRVQGCQPGWCSNCSATAVQSCDCDSVMCQHAGSWWQLCTLCLWPSAWQRSNWKLSRR